MWAVIFLNYIAVSSYYLFVFYYVSTFFISTFY